MCVQHSTTTDNVPVILSKFWNSIICIINHIMHTHARARNTLVHDMMCSAYKSVRRSAESTEQRTSEYRIVDVAGTTEASTSTQNSIALNFDLLCGESVYIVCKGHNWNIVVIYIYISMVRRSGEARLPFVHISMNKPFVIRCSIVRIYYLLPASSKWR